MGKEQLENLHSVSQRPHRYHSQCAADADGNPTFRDQGTVYPVLPRTLDCGGDGFAIQEISAPSTRLDAESVTISRTLLPLPSGAPGRERRDRAVTTNRQKRLSHESGISAFTRVVMFDLGYEPAGLLFRNSGLRDPSFGKWGGQVNPGSLNTTISVGPNGHRPQRIQPDSSRLHKKDGAISKMRSLTTAGR